MAQVFFLKLNKRNCEIRVRLTPIGADFMRVHFRIGGDNHYFYPSCVMGDQFSSFLTALYCLYNEEYDYHQLHMRQWKRRFGYLNDIAHFEGAISCLRRTRNSCAPLYLIFQPAERQKLNAFHIPQHKIVVFLPNHQQIVNRLLCIFLIK